MVYEEQDILFKTRRQSTHDPPVILVNVVQIEKASQYFELIIDKNLSWKPHQLPKK